MNTTLETNLRHGVSTPGSLAVRELGNDDAGIGCRARIEDSMELAGDGTIEASADLAVPLSPGASCSKQGWGLRGLQRALDGSDLANLAEVPVDAAPLLSLCHADLPGGGC